MRGSALKSRFQYKSQVGKCVHEPGFEPRRPFSVFVKTPTENFTGKFCLGFPTRVSERVVFRDILVRKILAHWEPLPGRDFESGLGNPKETATGWQPTFGQLFRQLGRPDLIKTTKPGAGATR